MKSDFTHIRIEKRLKTRLDKYNKEHMKKSESYVSYGTIIEHLLKARMYQISTKNKSKERRETEHKQRKEKNIKQDIINKFSKKQT